MVAPFPSKTLLDADLYEIRERELDNRLRLDVPQLQERYFANGGKGFLYMPRHRMGIVDLMFKDADGTEAVAESGDSVLRLEDLSGNDVVASGGRSLSFRESPARLVSSGNRYLNATIPDLGIQGVMVVASPEGTAAYGVNIPAGSYKVVTKGGSNLPAGSAFMGQIVVEGEQDDAERERLRQFLRSYGGGDNYAGVTNFAHFWDGWSEITEFPLIDTSNATIVYRTWRDCSGLTSFPALDLSSVDTSGSNEGFVEAWRGCTSLADFPAGMFDKSKSTNFTNAFVDTSLSSSSIDKILVSIEKAGTSQGVFNQSGGNGPGASGKAAINTLRDRGWVITVTDDY